MDVVFYLVVVVVIMGVCVFVMGVCGGVSFVDVLLVFLRGVVIVLFVVVCSVVVIKFGGLEDLFVIMFLMFL